MQAPIYFFQYLEISIFFTRIWITFYAVCIAALLF